MGTYAPLRLSLDRLPTELLHIIAADVRDYHVSSFVAFASASKTFRAACSPILFSAIVVEPPYDKIEATISRCIDALSLNGLLRHVQHLSLQITPPRGDWAEPRRPLTNLSHLPGTTAVDLNFLRAVVQPKIRNTDILYDNYDYLSDYCNEYGDVYTSIYASIYPDHHSSDDTHTWQVFQSLGLLVEDDDWLPLVRLIQVLPNLKDLSFNAQDDVFPSCLLEAIHEHLPRCRISIRQFALVGEEQTQVESSSIYDEDYSPGSESSPAPPLHPRDVALVRSPNVHDIHIQHNPHHFDGDTHGLEAALAMASRISPNIRAVHMTPCRSSFAAGGHLVRNWGRIQDLDAPSRLARLTTLALFDQSHLRQWNAVIDASALQSLSLGRQQCTFPSDTVWLAQDASFPNLKHLRLSDFPSFRGVNGWHAVEPFPRPQDTIAEFLARLPPLESLYMRGPVPVEIVQDLLPHHGPTLQKLTVRASITGHKFTKRVFQLIHEHCGMIQKLHIPLRRTASGTDEAVALDMLGNIKSLRILRLMLAQGYLSPEQEEAADYFVSEPELTGNIPSDPSWALDPLPPRTDQPLWTAWDNKRSFLDMGGPPIRNGDVRDALIRAAVDEKFARAVWDRLSCRQGCRLRLLELGGNANLSQLLHFPDPNGNLGSFSTSIALMATHFVLQRSMADDETVLVMDLCADKLMDPSPAPSAGFMTHFRRLWPEEADYGHWKEIWSSLPFPVPPQV